MNRRNFFKTVTGFIAGVLFVPKVKAEPEWKMVVAPYNGNTNTDDIEIISQRDCYGIFFPESGLWMSKEDYDHMANEKYDIHPFL